MKKKKRKSLKEWEKKGEILQKSKLKTKHRNPVRKRFLRTSK